VERYSGHFARRLGIPESVRQAMQQRFERRFGHRWEEFELPQSVAKVKAQALVIHDAVDRDVPASSGLALARAWPGAKFLRTRGLGHRLVLRDPSVVADGADFIADRVRFAPPAAARRSIGLFRTRTLGLIVEGDNVKNQQPREETGRVVALGAALWGSVVGIAALEGAFTRFDGASLAGAAAFVSFFAVLSYFLDPQLRAYASRMDAMRACPLALILAAGVCGRDRIAQRALRDVVRAARRFRACRRRRPQPSAAPR